MQDLTAHVRKEVVRIFMMYKRLDDQEVGSTGLDVKLSGGAGPRQKIDSEGACLLSYFGDAFLQSSVVGSQDRHDLKPWTRQSRSYCDRYTHDWEQIPALRSKRSFT